MELALAKQVVGWLKPTASAARNVAMEVFASHGPEILTGTGIVATGTALAYSIKVAPQAQEAAVKAEDTRLEQIKAGLGVYWPCILLYVGGVACIVSAHQIQAGKLAAASAAAAIFEKAANSLQDEVVEHIGEKADSQAEDGDEVPFKADYIVDQNGEITYMDMITGCVFKCSPSDWDKAESYINKKLASGEKAYLWEMLEKVRSSGYRGKACDVIGWDPTEGHRLDIHYGSTLTDRGLPVKTVLYKAYIIEPWAYRDSIS